MSIPIVVATEIKPTEKKHLSQIYELGNVGVLVTCLLVFTVFCIVCSGFLYCFVYVYLFLFVLPVLV